MKKIKNGKQKWSLEQANLFSKLKRSKKLQQIFSTVIIDLKKNPAMFRLTFFLYWREDTCKMILNKIWI